MKSQTLHAMTLTVLLAAACGPSLADQPLQSKRMEIKGYAIGDKFADSSRSKFSRCGTSDPIGSFCVAHKGVSFGDTVAKTLLVVFRGGRITGVNITFPEKDFDSVVDAMKEKYGPPTAEIQSAVTNKFGASFRQDSIVWHPVGSDLRMEASRRGMDIDTSTVALMSMNEVNATAQRSADKRKKSSGNL